MITSTSNVKVKRLVTLRKKRKARDEEGVFWVEGLRLFCEVPTEIIKEVYVSESFCQKEHKILDGVRNDSRVRAEVLSDHVYSYVSDTKNPQGVLCVVGQMKYDVEEMLQGECPHLVVLDNLQDPGNLGTIVRTCEAAGVTGVILSRDCVDIYNPKTIRSTMGSIFRVPFSYVRDMGETLDVLKQHGICTYAAHLKGRCAYDEEDYRKPCAFLIGNEGRGLRDAVADKAQVYVRIPMEGEVESLNAAVAATVLTFEAARQRRHG